MRWCRWWSADDCRAPSARRPCQLQSAGRTVVAMQARAQSVLEWAQRKVGAPYVWRGKGLQVWTPAGLARHDWAEEVFDCSGLVTCAVHACGGPDWRATHSAQTLFDVLAPALPWAVGALRLYGKSPRQVTHVALVLGQGSIVEAAGGDARTTTPALARARGAAVRVGPERRSDFVGARQLPAWPRPAA